MREVVRVHCCANLPPSDLLVILAEDDIWASAWDPPLGSSSIFWVSRSPGLLVLALRGGTRRRFLRGHGLEGLKAAGDASRSFAVITIPRGCNPGISWSSVIDRSTLS